MSQSFLSRLDEAAVFGEELVLISASNATIWLKNAQGQCKEYIDFMSAYGAVNFGHCNPKIQPFRDAVADIAACLYPPEASLFAEWLCTRLGLAEHRVLFQVGGSFAVSTALALVQRTRKGKIAAIQGAFHGLGIDTLCVTMTQRDLALQNTALLSSMKQQVIHLELGTFPDDWADISCLIYEPIQGANGYIPLDMDWLKALERSARAAGVFTIADEIQCGFFRHGSLSPARKHGLEPDILLYSKSMTNGLYPFSAVVYHRDLEQSIKSSVVLAHTFQTSALGCYAANAVASYLDSHPLDLEASRISDCFLGLKTQLEQIPIVSKIYVTGPTLSFEVADGGTRTLVRRCIQEGVIPFVGGYSGQRVRVAPPLTISDEQLFYGTQTLFNILKEMSLCPSLT